MNLQQQFQQQLYDTYGLFMSDLHDHALRHGGEVRLQRNTLVVSRPGFQTALLIPMKRNPATWPKKQKVVQKMDNPHLLGFPFWEITNCLHLLWEETDTQEE